MSNHLRKDALLNEYKGALFEYLVSLKIARHFGFEGSYLKQFSDNDFITLSQQESYIRAYKEDLLSQLNSYSEDTSRAIIKSIACEIKSLKVIGKVASAEKHNYSETDLMVEDNQGNFYQYSLKLSKLNSYVNTKSAGVKSFFEKYFNSSEIQKEFNSYFDFEFEIFAREIQELYGVDYDLKFSNWIEQGHPQLPGEVEQGKDLLLDFYGRINNFLFEKTKELYTQDEKLFLKNLAPLYGFSSLEVIQVICFHDNDNSSVKLKGIQNINDVKFVKNKSNFELKTNLFSLQIRLKPMNTFTNKSYKINCSVKYLN